MRYKCENCRRGFDFDDFIEFCPYCGKMLDGSAGVNSQDYSGVNVAQAIDSIWGDTARMKDEFSSVISQCFELINSCAENSIIKALPKEDLSKYEKNYAIIKQSNNRKTLLIRVNNYLDELDRIIDNVSDRIPADLKSRLELAVTSVDKMVKEIYDFLGVRYIPPVEDILSEENYSAEVLYTREQLRYLYNLVLVAFSKYKKCVEENNMFAAFSSTSDYGVMPDYWRRWISRLSLSDDEQEDAQGEEEDRHFDEVVKYMKSHNEIKYFGILDEDFVPHVDAFWYGIQNLSVFIDHHVAIQYNFSRIGLNSDDQTKLLRIISSRSFNVSEERLDSAFELRDRFKDQHEKMLDNK